MRMTLQQQVFEETPDREWWDLLSVNDPKFEGYFPKAIKTIRILKEKSLIPTATFLFGEVVMRLERLMLRRK